MTGIAAAVAGSESENGEEQQAVIDALVDEGACDAEARCVVDGLGDDAERLLTAETPPGTG